jgi:hypothetical protein
MNSNLLLAFIAVLGLTSCGTYQSAYNDDDGIYSSSSETQVAVSDESSDNGSDYFSKSYEEYRDISSDDLITNIDDYQYTDGQYIENDSISNISDSSPWGYSDNTTVNINLGNNFGFGGFGGFQNFNNPFGFGFNNYPFIGFNNSWRFRGVNYAYSNPYGFFYDIYCPPYYYNNFGGFNVFGGFNNFYFGRNFFGRNNNFRNYDRYGSRNAYNTRSNINRRQITNRVSSRTPNTSRTRRTIGTNTQRATTRRTPSNTTRSNTRTRSSSNNSSTRSTRTPSTTRRSSSTRSTSRSRSTTSRPRRR